MNRGPLGIVLSVQTPTHRVYQGRVLGLTAEDASGRFGIRPGCEPLLASVVPGLLTVRPLDADELWIAVGSGVLRAERESVEVAVRHAVVCTSVEQVRDELEAAHAQALAGEERMRGALGGLLRELALAMVRSEQAS